MTHLAECLGVPSDLARTAVWEALATVALRRTEWSRCLELTLQLIRAPTVHGRAWQLCERLCALSDDASTPSSNARAAGAHLGAQLAEGTDVRNALDAAGAAGAGARAASARMLVMDLSERGELLGHALAHCPASHFDQAMRLWREWRRQPGALSWALDEDLPTGAHDDASAHDDADGARDGAQGAQYGAEGAGVKSDVAPPSGDARALDGAVAGASAAGAAAFRAMRDEAEGNAMAWVMHAKRLDEAASATAAPRAPVNAPVNVPVNVNDAARSSAALLKACLAAGEDDQAVVLIADRPTAAWLATAATALQQALQAAASRADVGAVRRLASIGVHGFGLALALAAADKEGCRSAEAALGARSLAELLRTGTESELLRTGTEDGTTDASADAPSTAPSTAPSMAPSTAPSTAPIAAAARTALVNFESVLTRVHEASRLARWLPDLDSARYAADEQARRHAIGRLASAGVSTPGAFDEAMRIAPSVGMDLWELHLACVELALTRPVSDDAPDGDGGAAGAGGAGSHGSGQLEASITAVISRHEIALLAHPDRLCYTLVSRVLPLVCPSWCP